MKNKLDESGLAIGESTLREVLRELEKDEKIEFTK